MTQPEFLPPAVLPYEHPTGDSLTKYDLGILAVRITGLYFLSLAVVYAAYIPSYFLYRRAGFSSDFAMVGTALAPCVVFGVIGVLLLCSADRFARLAFPEFVRGSTVSIRGQDLHAVAYAAIGAYMIASAVPEIVRQAIRLWFAGILLSNQQLHEMIPDAAKLLVQLLAGVILIARGKRLRILAHRLRYAGITPPPPSP